MSENFGIAVAQLRVQCGMDAQRGEGEVRFAVGRSPMPTQRELAAGWVPVEEWAPDDLARVLGPLAADATARLIAAYRVSPAEGDRLGARLRMSYAALVTSLLARCREEAASLAREDRSRRAGLAGNPPSALPPLDA